MCGITGIFSAKGAASKDLVELMTDGLRHRGPDSGGVYTSPDAQCVLGHRRLSILDLSNAADQPMHSNCGRYTMVYNGEVYNFKEIRKEIEKYKPIPFKTNSDSEVILEAFALWGKSFVFKLNGMFSIAIYDNQEATLWLFRDRMGIKPLFYFWNEEIFAFSSELKSILLLRKKIGAFNLNKEAVNSYLRLGYVPEPHTIYQEVSKFESAHFGAVNSYGFSHECYWNINKKISKNVVSDEKIAKSKLKKLLESSVNYRMVSDVPFGTFLSGGIDSSTVTAIAQSQSETAINTFSIGFKEASFNEAEHAAKIAKHLNTNHHEYIVSYSDAIEKLDKILDAYDEPYADSSAIPTMLVSEMAKKKVTMTLSGDGGDEQFLGYGAYTWAKRLNNPINRLLKSPANFILRNLKNNKYRRAAEHFRFNQNTHLPSHIFSVEQYFFSDKELKEVLSSNFYTELSFPKMELERELTCIEEQAFFDLKYYLKDDLLVKVDRASMQYSLETRVPLLDHRIVEFSINLDQGLKQKNGRSKHLLKSVLYDYVPKEYFERPKWGFGLPVKDWLSKEWSFLIDKYLNTNILTKYKLFNVEKVEEIKTRFLKGEDYLFNKLWTIIILNQWLEKNEELTIF